MKRLSVMLLGLASIAILLAGCGGKSTVTSIPTGSVAASPLARIRIGVDATFPPFELPGTNRGDFTGFDIELMKAIAARANLEVEFVNVSLNQVMTGVLDCSYDGGMSAITITDELKKQMEFSDPYLTVAQVVVVKKGNITINSRDQLAEMTVGAQLGSTGAIEIQNIPGARLETYPSIDLAFQGLINGDIDAVITGRPRAQVYAGIPANNLKIVGDEFASESYGIAICKKNADLVKKINAGLADVKADGTLVKLTQKWIKKSGQ